MGADSPLAPSLLSVMSVMEANAVTNGAEVLLAQLESQGVDCIFASPIAAMAPTWKALARRGNDMELRVLTVSPASDSRRNAVFRCSSCLAATGSTHTQSAKSLVGNVIQLTPSAATRAEAVTSAQTFLLDVVVNP